MQNKTSETEIPKSFVVKVPLNKVNVRRIYETRQASQASEPKFTRMPDNEEIAEAMGISEKDDKESIDTLSEASSITREMINVVEVLNENERQILQLYFGINHETSHTLEEIGSQLNISRDKVMQVKDRALQKIKRSLKAQKFKNLFW